MLPVAQSKDFDPIVIKIFIKMGGDVDSLHLLPNGQELTKANLNLLMTEVKVKTPTMVALIGCKEI